MTNDDKEMFRSTFAGIIQGNCEHSGDCSWNENDECFCDRIVNELVAAVERLSEEIEDRPMSINEAVTVGLLD